MGGALLTLATRARLGTDTDNVSELDSLGLLSDPGDLSDNLVSDDDRIVGRSPSRSESVQVRGTDSRVVDLLHIVSDTAKVSK